MYAMQKDGEYWVLASWYHQQGDELAAAEAVIEDLTACNAELLAVCKNMQNRGYRRCPRWSDWPQNCDCDDCAYTARVNIGFLAAVSEESEGE